MSLPIWTQDALRSECKAYRGTAWRLVEAQHIVSTHKLVDYDLAEQQVLEAILEDSKPPVPDTCAHLDYLLSTPFRYKPYPHGSRFRRAGMTPGVWYGSETPDTSVAEMVFYRYLFYAESPGTSLPKDASEYTAFCVQLNTPIAVDLTAGALSADSAFWTDATDYTACQDLAQQARDLGAEIIRYQSVRDPAGRAAIAVLQCSAFAEAAPSNRQTWRVHIARTGAVAICEYPRHTLEFKADSFQNDPRIVGIG